MPHVRYGVSLALLLGAVAAPTASADFANSVDLSNYVRVGRYNLPEPTRTSAPANNKLAQEASGVTFDWDTQTLFVVGDGGTSVTQVSKTGDLIDTMTLPPGASPAGTEFYDTEGITYIGGGQFVITEERDRQLVRFTYVPGGTLQRADAKTVKLGTTIGNIGLEGVSYDPPAPHTNGDNGFVVVKEKDPESIFATDIDWNALTATNGSPGATGSTDLFTPSLASLSDFSDVYALRNVTSGADADHLLMISQESGKIINIDRSGTVASSLTLHQDADNSLSIPDQTHEGVTMDDNGVLYEVNENGGGDSNHPQLWVFTPSAVPNQPPTAVALTNQTTSIPENSSTATRVKVADVVVTDDGLGTNNLTVTGPDAASFDVDANGLYLKAGTALNHTTKPSYTVSVAADDPTSAASPDAVTASAYTLTVTAAGAAGPSVIVTEVAPWGSSNNTAPNPGSDWFELTNNGASRIDLTGWKMDDASNSSGLAVALNGVSTLLPGESAVFLEGASSKIATFKTFWNLGAGVKVGNYSGTGVGLSTDPGDEVNIFDASNTHVTGVAFGVNTTNRTFDNVAGAGSATGDRPTITALSTAGVNGAVTVGSAPAETGSPGTVPVSSPLAITEVASWGSGNATYNADWWELTNLSTQTIDLTGFKMDDLSNLFSTAVALNGVTTLSPGQSAIFLEGTNTKATAFTNWWFGTSVPAGYQIGTYSGSGVGLSASDPSEGVNIFNATGDHVAGVTFGPATTGVSYDNAAAARSYTASPTISTLSVAGQRGAFEAHDEVGSPGAIANRTGVIWRGGTARRSHGRTVVRWRIAKADDVLGFNVLRVRHGRSVKLNRRLITAIGTVSGRFRFVDRAGRAGDRYRVRLVTLDGQQHVRQIKALGRAHDRGV